MRKLLVALAAGLVLAVAFVVSPFVAVWTIREAIRTGDAAVIDARLEWPTVRETLRQSMTEYAIGPTPVAAPGASPARIGIWQRVKNGLSRRAVDNLVAAYVTPQGLPQLFTARQFYRTNVSGEQAKLDAMRWHERVAEFWSRLKRAEFHSPTMFEIEIADRNDPGRHYVGLLKLRGLEWMLTELHVRKAPITPSL